MIPLPPLGQASAHPNEAMNSIQKLLPTLGPSTVLLSERSPAPTRQSLSFGHRKVRISVALEGASFDGRLYHLLPGLAQVPCHG
jgi:hypothetical protein